MKWEELTPRQRDALVAEKVMGITFQWEDAPVHHYSTDIAAAWEVVERVTRIPQSLAEAERAANTRFCYWWERTPLWSYAAAEAAKMICTGALIAVGAIEE